ncbi:MAG: pyridoxal 5'-phosphate synthase lyase subunit PdxS [Thermoplasmata archaeon]|nr:pyridoxal 5'-phosphate synthase lyase subunit PdxS [Thermoplasmata archaeon]
MIREIDLEKLRHGTELLKRGFARMQKGGVVMDVTDASQARIAEEAGAVAVMALERVPADIRAQGGVARMADPTKIIEIIDTVSIPIMAKARIGHFVEAQILQSLGVDMVDESEVLTPADPHYHIDKRDFTIPFVCGARDLGEALRRIHEGAAMIRTKGEAGTGDIIEAVRHQHAIMGTVRSLKGKTRQELYAVARQIEAPVELVEEVALLQRLPVVNFAAGGIATPADAAMMMQMGTDGVFVGSGIFKSKKPEVMAKAIVEATMNYDDPKVLAKVSEGIGDPMAGINVADIPKEKQLQNRGW